MMLVTVLASIIGFYLLCCVMWCIDDERMRWDILKDPERSESEKHTYLALLDEIRVFHTGNVGLSVKRFVFHLWMYHSIGQRWAELDEKYGRDD